LGTLIQFGKVGTEITVTNNMGVAPDFAFGEFSYIPSGYTQPTEYIPTFIGDVVIAKPPHWTFVDHGTDMNFPNPPILGGYYLAIYSFAEAGSSKGFVEAYDTALHPGVTFHDFVFGGHGVAGVLTKYGSNPSFGFTVFGETIYTYETQSGQQIQFSISGSNSEILSTTEAPGSESGDAWKKKFASGTILNSEQGSGIIAIANPALGTSITLNMRDPHLPFRVSESGAVERAGVPREVWVDFNYGSPGTNQAGDFGDPFVTLAAARDRVAAGGTINIIPGSRNEPIVIRTPVTLKSFPGSATIGAR
jgi:hypothetical protein